MSETEETGNGLRGIIVVPLLVLLGVGLYLGSALNSPTDQSVAPGVQAEAPQQTPVQETDQLVIATQDPGSTAESEGVASTVAATQDEGAAVAESEVEVAQEPVPSTVEFVSPDEVREAVEDNSVAEAEPLDPSPGEESQDTLAEEAAPQTGEITTAALAGSSEDGSQSPIEVPDAKPGPTLVETPAASLPDIVSAAEDPAEPQFDLVRIEQDGAGLIAGRAEPGATVRVLSGQKEIARVEASASGEFVAFIDAPGEEEGRGLSLVAEDQAGKVARSESEVFIIPAATTGEADEAPAAPAVVEASDSGVRLLQPAGLAAVDGVTLDSVSYARDGAVVLAGRAPEDADLRVYANGRALGDVKAGQTGSWDARLDDLAEGVYTLRIDQIDDTGAVLSRVESPFQRVFPSAEILDRPTSITVQPGNTLWVMARDRYGSGFEYTQIYAANSNLIRDPDLIYPGQIFTLPKDNRGSN